MRPGELAVARTGFRQSGTMTPASIACATDVGMRAISVPRAGTAAVAMMSRPVTTNAPIAVGQPPAGVGLAASSAAPGVDHAIVIGIR